MIKCVYEQCCWPECDKTCGLVPTGDYVVGSCAEEGLIYHLQEQAHQASLRAFQTWERINNIESSARELTRTLSKAKDCCYPAEYIPTCPYGFTDCIYDPAYIRCYHKDRWIKLGMPTSCGESVCENGECYSKWII